MRTLNVRRIGYALGAEVSGLDLKARLSDEIVQEIRGLWIEHLVLCFPGQNLTKAELLAFARRFGPPELVGHPDPESPHIALVTEGPIAGKPATGYKAGQVWHSDKSFTTTPTDATFLNAKQIPSVGGDTMFANMYAAYDTLWPAMREIAGSLSAIHDYELRVRGGAKSGPSTKDLFTREGELPSPTVHPAVRRHPETGRNAIYIGDRVRRFVGMTEEESKPLLDFLKRHSVSYELTYRHRWRLDDLLMWDNRCTTHIALSDYDARLEPRIMWRCAVVGPESGVKFRDEDMVSTSAGAVGASERNNS